MQNFFSDIKAWFAKPFDPQGSALSWIAFLGLVILGAFFWQLVLLSFLKDVKEV